MLRRGGTSAVSPELGSSPVESPLNYAEAGIAVFDVAEAGSIAVRWPPGASRLEIQRTRSGGVVLRPRTGDLRAESMLDYAMEGYSAHASMIRGDAQARELIDREHQSPAGALIGAYYLVKTGEARRYVELLDELNQNFPELPDTAVALGSSLLQADAPRELIRGAFLQAASLGIPIYREGLRQLRAGLDFLFAEGHDDEIVAAIEAIRPHQMALHYDNAVTSWSSWPGTAEPAARASLAPTRLHLAEAAPPLAAAADDDGDTEVEAGD